MSPEISTQKPVYNGLYGSIYDLSPDYLDNAYYRMIANTIVTRYQAYVDDPMFQGQKPRKFYYHGIRESLAII